MRTKLSNALIFCFLLSSMTSLFAAGPYRHGALPAWIEEAVNGPIESWLLKDQLPKKALLLLKETNVQLDVTGSLVHAEVEQVFYNDTNEILEVEYTFPLPEKATVTGMKMILDDRTITSVVEEKAQARKTYTEATKQGKQAVLLEQNRPNVFTSLINRLDPGAQVTVHFSYLEPLPFQLGRYQLVFPTTFGSRYIPKTMNQESPDALNSSDVLERLQPLYVDQTENLFSLQAQIFGLPIDDVTSTTHNLYFDSRSAEEVFLEVDRKDFVPDRDVIIDLVLAKSQVPKSQIIQSKGIEGTHGLLQVFPPSGIEEAVDLRPKEVIFLIDTSSSMMGLAMKQARDGLKACLKMLNPEDRFNIVAYNDQHEMFKKSAVINSPEMLQKGLNYAASLKADGGTELQAALHEVLTMPRSEDHLPWVVLLTDGDVGNETQLLSMVHKSEHQNRIFSFGLGSAPNRYLLTKLGEVGGGFATVIEPDRDLTLTMTQFFHSVMAPVLTDVEVTFYHADGQQANVELYPSTPPDLYMNRPLELCFRSEWALDGTAEVRGIWEGKSVSYQVPINASENKNFQGIDKVFGKAWLDDLMVDYYTAANSGAKDRVKADIVKTALDYQLVTPFTSRVAVTKQTVTQESAVMASAMVPLVQPASRTYPVTATQDLLWFGFGFSLLSIAALLMTRKKLINA